MYSCLCVFKFGGKFNSLKNTYKIDSGSNWREPVFKVVVEEQLNGYTMCSQCRHVNVLFLQHIEDVNELIG